MPVGLLLSGSDGLFEALIITIMIIIIIMIIVVIAIVISNSNSNYYNNHNNNSNSNHAVPLAAGPRLEQSQTLVLTLIFKDCLSMLNDILEN